MNPAGDISVVRRFDPRGDARRFSKPRPLRHRVNRGANEISRRRRDIEISNFAAVIRPTLSLLLLLLSRRIQYRVIRLYLAVGVVSRYRRLDPAPLCSPS